VVAQREGVGAEVGEAQTLALAVADSHRLGQRLLTEPARGRRIAPEVRQVGQVVQRGGGAPAEAGRAAALQHLARERLHLQRIAEVGTGRDELEERQPDQPIVPRSPRER